MATFVKFVTAAVVLMSCVPRHGLSEGRVFGRSFRHVGLAHDSLVGQVIGQVVEEYLSGCYLVSMTQNGQSTAMGGIVRNLAKRGQAAVVVDVGTLIPSQSRNGTSLLQSLREGDAKFPCRAFVLDVTAGVSDPLMRFLEDTNLYLWPDTRIVVLGAQEDLGILGDRAFRNTANSLLLALSEQTLRALRSRQGVGYWSEDLQEAGCSSSAEASQKASQRCQEVWLYYRCLYCAAGEAAVQLLDRWTPQRGFLKGADLFPDQFRDFNGHKFRIVSMNWFPFLDFSRDSNASATTVTPKESLDFRMLSAISALLNFTYVMRTPWDNQWGVSQANGNWTGTVGTLQHHQADFSMLLSWMGPRMAVVDYSRVYVSEPLVVVTRKPSVLPQYLALVRPFPVVLWAAILIASMVTGVVLWGLQRAWAYFSGGRVMELSSALLKSWGILLEDPPHALPANLTGQVLVGVWWVFCMIITMAYRSSLVAHLSVPGKSPTIDTLEQLLAAKGWTWGMEKTYGIGWEWFRTSTVPTVQRVNAQIEALEPQEHLDKVLQGNHAFLTWKYYIKAIILSKYTTNRGYTPMYTGRQEYINYGGYGWGFRKGAPFRRRIDRVKQRLLEGGLVDQWMEELIEKSSREARRRNPYVANVMEEERGRVVLGMKHLQGAFYLLGLGFAGALLILLGEGLARRLARDAHESK